jgi:lysophospholipase L1-like esterase
MDGIIQLLLANNIRPIIQEIPDYDIPKTFYRQSRSRKVLRYFSMFINNTSKDCKADYRNALNELINEKGYQDKVSIVRYKSWNKDYQNDLVQLYVGDGMHLNTKGYEKLDSVIAQEIITQHTKQ